MATPGQVLQNPITGEHITILETTREAGGESLVFDCRVAPGKATLPAHVHGAQEERFEVISGQLGVMLGGKKRVLGPGQRIILPAKVRHQWWNAGDDEVHFRVKVIPAGNLELVLEALCTMARTGKVNKDGMPRNPFDLVLVGRLGETYLPFVPISIQKICLSLGSGVAWLLGHDPTLAEYRSRDLESTAQTAQVEDRAA